MFHLRSLKTAIIVAASCLAPVALADEAAVPGHVGSKTCISCHQDAGRSWRESHHALAWTLPDDTTVLGDFDDAEFEHKDTATRFTRDEEGFFIETEDQESVARVFEVEGVVGIAPLQQYIVATEEGRFQALDVAWDTRREQWYHLYPEQDFAAEDGLHWTGSYKNWNARCAECHATGFQKNYDHQARRYKSTEAEIGVGCEACHGPGEAHVAWARRIKIDDEKWPDLTEMGFTIGFAAGAAETEIQQCAGCHARRESFLDGNPLPGTEFHDAYRLALLRPGLYHADGSIEDEVYVYGSFLQSKMYANGVRCSDCHDPHGASLKAEGNALCVGCHSPSGNQRFPSLRKAAYDGPTHHFHDDRSAGAECTGCHMIERTYMGIDGRRDHSFRIPRPDLSEETATPNACTDCHTDRDAAWAAAALKRQFPNSKRFGAHFSQTFASARKDPGSAKEALLEIAEDDGMSGIVRATALDLLRPIADTSIAARTKPLLEDDDPLLRMAAVPLQRGAEEAHRAQRLAPLLNDRLRAVRVAAAREFIDTSSASLSKKTAGLAKKALKEWQELLLAKTDFPETHLVIGGTALAQRNTRAAEGAFREAVRLDPQAVDGWIMIARIHAATGDANAARQALDEALSVNPTDDRLLALDKELDAAMVK